MTMEKLGSTYPAPLVQRQLRLSVIIPVRNGADVLVDSLAAVRASDFPADEFELIVVDDGSTDGSADVAARFADTVERLSSGQGPAAARNQGARRARGTYLVFIDADVCVHPGVLRRFVEIFATEPGIAAIFGAYDTRPRAPGLVSQYRNLLHHYVHAQSPGDAETFWAGCGAMRRDVFVETGGFDESIYQLEDVELGYRVRELGYRILLRPELQGTHLKRWTLRSMVTTDLFGRGITWMRLTLQQGQKGRPGTLNLAFAEKLYTMLSGLAICAIGIAAVRREAVWLVAAVGAVLIVLIGNAPMLRWYARERGFWFALRIVPLRLLYYILNDVAAVLGLAQHALAPRVGRARVPGPAGRPS